MDDARVEIIRSLLRSFCVHHFVDQKTGTPWWCVLPGRSLERSAAVSEHRSFAEAKDEADRLVSEAILRELLG